jgi:hypothetical protein
METYSKGASKSVKLINNESYYVVNCSASRYFTYRRNQISIFSCWQSQFSDVLISFLDTSVFPDIRDNCSDGVFVIIRVAKISQQRRVAYWRLISEPYVRNCKIALK